MRPLESIWTPTQKQSIALACPAYELMYGGAKGGGKTDFLLFDHVNQHLLAHRHWEQKRLKSTTMALLLRKEFGRLKDLIQRSHTYFPILSEGAMTWKEAEHTWYCACGYRVWFGHCEGPQDHELYQGQEIGHLGIDQGEEIPYNQYAYIKLQVRTSHAYLEPTLAVRLTANPGGRHGAWVKKRFVDPDRKGMVSIPETVEIDRNGVKTSITKERVFIPAFLWDNPHLSVGYEAELRLAPEHMRRAFLDGDWDVVEGSFFGDVFDATIHVIDDLGPLEIRIPSNWPVFRCADWGSRSPSACYWVCVDNDGLLVVLDELYGPGDTPDRWARRILQVEEAWGWTEKPRGMEDRRVSVSKLQGVLDPSCFKDNTTGGPKIANQVFEEGVVFYEGDDDRKAGWVELRRRLMERGGASKKIPGLRIARRCVNLIRTLPNAISDKNEPDDVDTKQEDHAIDAIRYGVMSRPRGRVESEMDEHELKNWERVMLRQAQASANNGRNQTTGY